MICFLLQCWSIRFWLLACIVEIGWSCIKSILHDISLPYCAAICWKCACDWHFEILCSVCCVSFRFCYDYNLINFFFLHAVGPCGQPVYSIARDQTFASALPSIQHWVDSYNLTICFRAVVWLAYKKLSGCIILKLNHGPSQWFPQWMRNLHYYFFYYY